MKHNQWERFENTGLQRRISMDFEGMKQMKISTRGRYALRMMVDLAMDESGGFVPIRQIAARQDISGKYMEQIINALSRAGYVKSSRGVQGGYCLSKAPELYTVGMILRTIEGDLAPVACLVGEDNSCPRKDSCVTLDVWRQIEDAIGNVVDHITLADLVTKQKKKNAL